MKKPACGMRPRSVKIKRGHMGRTDMESARDWLEVHYQMAVTERVSFNKWRFYYYV